ncbi:(p)ppGpp synthetase I, SpoT/RelA [Thermobaculum terrenum ATCC BAA-798]|uniref:(P)ppGpp synthetase I, SpoT/RelA n=1 Tax=Thermobaculum terrenum (strain ATCC BAA-798 / CCMEE 7001 / YNP1) TaxID=525904 RepID=D1CG58_THET1|nr:bifunctional (p)ppGpp synthetase/guanosine-3',5'-bis(diphosphate) 3'-pyrophosphohydrolase [Thermobaculum terrenum]ACZ41914.1 (p)ppGpp synthetase I, SpoT/RelA [Thermobaculum terrenum ATCC BAA-798]
MGYWETLDKGTNYLSSLDKDLIRRAYEVADKAHEGEYRKSGEPFISHPVNVALILADLKQDAQAIASALLHDTVEDTNLTLDDIETIFGPEVSRLVDGLTKLNKIRLSPDDEKDPKEQQAQAENLRKMFLAMVEDPRVVLIKLADRLHNMRTIEHLPRDKQLSKARETLEIYAPLAGRLGIFKFRSELEDLSFKVLYPDKYREIAAQVERSGVTRGKYIEQAIDVLKKALDAEGIPAEITGRRKHLYSIYRKMEQKQRSFDQIFDVLGLRVITDEVMQCYAALGVIHSIWRPIPGEFDDYIAMPKESMYQSLHTAVVGLDGKPLEIQIRTRDMHEVAEYGIAAHWRYKEGKKANEAAEHRITWLRQLLEWRDEVADAQEFVESMKSDLLQEHIYVFTPNGDVVELPRGATPIDFAYRIHTEIGHHCVGATVNGRLVSLDYVLQNGDVVKIRTSKTKQGPSRDWLNPAYGYVRTASAREKIRQWFRKQERTENIAQGREMVERELRRLGLEHLKLEEVAAHFPNYQKLDDFLAAVGYGAINTSQIAGKLVVQEQKTIMSETLPKAVAAATDVKVMGVGDLLTTLARCCSPMLGDEILGYVTRGRGVSIHRADCPNIQKADPERIIQVSWDGTQKQLYSVVLQVVAIDRVGLLRDVSTVVSNEKINMRDVQTFDHKDHTVTIQFAVEVADGAELSRLLLKLERLPDVIEVRRRTPSASAAKTA